MTLSSDGAKATPQRATLADVARLANVSMATVSNVLNRSHIVAPKTRDRVSRAMARLQYVPNGAARQLAAGRSRALGLVLLDLANPFYLEVARGVEFVAAEAGFVVLLFNTGNDRSREERALRALQEQRVSGLLISPIGSQNANVQRLRDEGTRVVLLDRPGAARGECSVSMDDVDGGRQAAEHLLRLGRSRFAFVGGGKHKQHRDRLKGIRIALENAGRDPLSVVVEYAELSMSGGEQAAEALVRHRPVPDAVICGNDVLAVGVVRMALSMGVRVPDDIAVVGYDDVDLARVTAVPLTSVQQPMYMLGKRAAELVIDEVTNESHKHERVVFQPTLVTRSSCGASTVDDGRLLSLGARGR